MNEKSVKMQSTICLEHQICASQEYFAQQLVVMVETFRRSDLVRLKKSKLFSRKEAFCSATLTLFWEREGIHNTGEDAGFLLLLKLEGVAPLIANPPPLKLHQQANATPSVKWP